ncbi:19019_t:CDS:2 [Entrophospora sp. SA101]|nr:7126_t:CDS:2 [Entrophospora sp. SA101]CAJ0762158.1 19019_t:CDS:2 [Entrophospora sp. SA101]
MSCHFAFNNGNKCSCWKFTKQDNSNICQTCNHQNTFHSTKAGGDGESNNSQLLAFNNLNYSTPQTNPLYPATVGSNKNNKTVCFTIICIKDVYNFSEVPTIPRSGTEYYKNLVRLNLIKEIIFPGENNNIICSTIESEFSLLQKDQWCFYKPAGSDLYPIQRGNSGYVLQIIKKVAGSNKKLYIGPTDKPLDIKFLLDQQILESTNSDLSFSNNNALFNISPENYHVDHTSTLFDSSPEYLNYSFDNLDDINKSLYDFYDKKYKLNDRKINIDIGSSETILKDLIKWISNANDEALLLKPTIRFITER